MPILRGGPFDGKETHEWQGSQDNFRNFPLRLEFKGVWVAADMVYRVGDGDDYHFWSVTIRDDQLQNVHWN